MTTAVGQYTVDRCRACGKEHKDVALHSLEGLPSHHTHWYKCPHVGDPVRVKFEPEIKAPIDSSVYDAVAAACQTRRYLIAVFSFNEQSDTPVGKFYRNEHLPHAEFQGCLDWLKSELSEQLVPGQAEKAPEEQLQRLPYDIFGKEPKVNRFSKNGEE